MRLYNENTCKSNRIHDMGSNKMKNESLPNFITVQQAIDEVNRRIFGTGFRLEICDDLSTTVIMLKKGGYSRRVYINTIDNTYESFCHSLHNGYTNYGRAYINAFGMMPCFKDTIDKLDAIVKDNIEFAIKEKGIYATI